MMNSERNTRANLITIHSCLFTMMVQMTVIGSQFYDFQIQVIVLYRDKSLYIWDIANIHRVGKYRSYLFHSACVCAIEVCVFVLYFLFCV